MSDLFDTIVTAGDTERPSFRQAPVGDYLASVREARTVTANTGNKGIEVTFTLQENLNGADMEDVDLAKCRVKDTLWVTEKTIDFVKEKLGRISPETEGISIRDCVDVLPSSEVVLRIAHITHDREGKELRTPWLEVKGYYTKSWYFANKLAA